MGNMQRQFRSKKKVVAPVPVVKAKPEAPKPSMANIMLASMVRALQNPFKRSRKSWVFSPNLPPWEPPRARSEEEKARKRLSRRSKRQRILSRGYN